MPANTRTRTNTSATPDPREGADALLAAALAAIAQTQPSGKRQTGQTPTETLSQELTARDRAALTRMGWQKLSSNKPAEPKPTAKPKNGPSINPATFAALSQERRNANVFWAGLCSTLSRSNGKIWLPEIAAVAAQLEVLIPSPSQLCNRLAALTGAKVERPQGQAGWLVCNLPGEMVGAPVWVQLWQSHLAAFGATVTAEE
jgi:hypothetical protein